MKKLRLLLLALAVIALLVAGVSITVFADDTVLTVNGTAYTAETVSSVEIPDGAAVVVYQPCVNIPYNQTATYTRDANSGISCVVENAAEGKIHFGYSGANNAAGGWSTIQNITADMLTSENEGDITVTIYNLVANLPYNTRAQYVIGYGCTQIRIFGNKITVNKASTISASAGDIVIGCSGTYFNAVAAHSTATFLAAQELATERPDLNVTVPAEYIQTTFKAVDKTTGIIGFGTPTSNVTTTTADTVVTVFGTTGAITCAEGAKYVFAEGSAAAFTATDSSTIRFFAPSDFANNISCNYWKTSEKVVVKLLKDVSITTTGAFNIGGSGTVLQEIHLDLNGHKFINVNTTNLASYSSSTPSFLGTGGIGAGEHFYLYSSVPGGELRHHVTVNGQVGSHYVFAPPANGGSIHLGAAEVDGKKISGDNLTMYGGILDFSSGKSNINVFVDGGTYYNIVSGSGRYASSFTFGNWGTGTAFNIKNAKFYSANGRFIANYGANVSDAVFNIDNCDFYSNGTSGAFCIQPGQTLNVRNSSFYQAKNSETFVWSPASDTAPTVSFTNCVMSDGFNMNANVKDNLIDNATIEIAHGESFKIPTVAFAEGSTTELVNSYTPIGTLSYSKLLTSKIFAEHNISLGSDPIYNLYVPKCISNISVKLNGVDHSYTLKPYDEMRNVISIAVGAKNTLDEIVVSSTVGEFTDSITSNLMAYVDQALSDYPDDARLQSLLLAVKDYSKAAAEYFGYNAEAFSYEYSENLEALVLEGKKLTIPSDAFLAKIDGAKLRLDGEIAFVFSVADGASGEASLNYFYGGKEKSETVALEGKSEIEISVKARDLNRGVTITVNGESLTYGLQNYVYAMSTNEALDEGKKAALMKLLAYMTDYCSDACPGHVETDAIIGNEVEPGAETEGSYDKTVFCSECDSVISHETVVVPALLDGFTYTKNGDKYVISDVAYTGERTDIVLPVGVTSVPQHVFRENANITSVVFPEGLTQLAWNQFYKCTSLKSVSLPSTLVTINTNAFYNASALESLTIPASVTTFNYGGNTLRGMASLKSISVEDGNPLFKEVDGVLYSKDGTTIVKFPVADSSFTEYTALDTVTSISSCAFEGAQYLQTLNLPNDTIVSIGSMAFFGATKLQGLMVLSSQTLTLGSEAFYNTKAEGSKLEIVIPKDVTFTNREFRFSNALVYYMGTQEEWSALENVQNTSNTGTSYDTQNRVFFYEPESPVEGATYWRMVDGVPTTYVSDGEPIIHKHTPLDAVIENEVPATCQNAGQYDSVIYCATCNEVISRTTVTVDKLEHTPLDAVIENNVPATPLADGSYDVVITCSECQEIISRETVILPKFSSDYTYAENQDGTYTVTGLANASVTEVVIPDGVTAIADDAFYDNLTITSVSIPASVKTIGANAFATAKYGSGKLASVTIAEGVVSIGEKAFSQSSIKSIIVPSSVTSMGTAVFYNCTLLETVEIRANITTLPTNTIRGCGMLKLAILPDTLTKIGGAYAFNSTGNANTIIILPKSLNAFDGSGTYNAKATMFYKGTESDWTNAFGNKTLTSWQGNAACTSVLYYYSESAPANDGYYWHYVNGVPTAWANSADREAMNDFQFLKSSDSTYTVISLINTDVTEIALPEGVTVLPANIFRGNTAITSVVIPDSITSLGTHAFYGCSSLETAIIGSGVKKIDTYTFGNCPKLQLVVLKGVTQLGGSYVFYNGSTSAIVIVPETITSIYSSALQLSNEKLFFEGTSEEWAAKGLDATLQAYKGTSTTATLYFYSESEPTTTGKYWHYDTDGTPVAW